jgi:hypothetical protein
MYICMLYIMVLKEMNVLYYLVNHIHLFVLNVFVKYHLNTYFEKERNILESKLNNTKVKLASNSI